MNNQNKNELRDTESLLTVARREGSWKTAQKKVKRLRSTVANYKNSRGDIKNSTGNIANNIVVSMHGVRWEPDLAGESVSHVNV